MNKGSVLIISGPSGAGKSTILKKASKEIGDFYFSISTTTREPRETEEEGREYYFVSKEKFEEEIKKGSFLEYAKVHDNYYGTSINPIKEAIKKGKLVIFDIDIQGHRLVKDRLKEKITSIFITPPSLKELKNRLLLRCSEDNKVFKKRVENAKEEIEAINEYDFILINDNLEEVTKKFINIVKTTKYKLNQEEVELFTKEWLNI